MRTETGKRLPVTPWHDPKFGALVCFPRRAGYCSTVAKVQGDEFPFIVAYLDVPGLPALGYTALSRVRTAKDYQVAVFRGGPASCCQTALPQRPTRGVKHAVAVPPVARSMRHKTRKSFCSGWLRVGSTARGRLDPRPLSWVGRAVALWHTPKP